MLFRGQERPSAVDVTDMHRGECWVPAVGAEGAPMKRSTVA